MYGRLYGTTEGRNVVLNPVPSHSYYLSVPFEGIPRAGELSSYIMQQANVDGRPERG